jgi:hypothetical protein
VSQSPLAPKTDGAKQTGFMLSAGKRTGSVAPIDPALCCFAALPCRCADGRALVLELHAIGLAPSLVSGWFASVELATDDEMVTPRFERASGVVLWEALLAYRFGRRDGGAP